jgi:hypothetical protein
MKAGPTAQFARRPLTVAAEVRLMSLQSPLTAEFLRWGALCFVGPASREWPKQDTDSWRQAWPWIVLLLALALCQMAVGIMDPEQTADIFIFAMM